jgi:hypothetical protein
MSPFASIPIRLARGFSSLPASSSILPLCYRSAGCGSLSCCSPCLVQEALHWGGWSGYAVSDTRATVEERVHPLRRPTSRACLLRCRCGYGWGSLLFVVGRSRHRRLRVSIPLVFVLHKGKTIQSLDGFLRAGSLNRAVAVLDRGSMKVAAIHVLVPRYVDHSCIDLVSITKRYVVCYRLGL